MPVRAMKIVRKGALGIPPPVKDLSAGFCAGHATIGHSGPLKNVALSTFPCLSVECKGTNR